MKIAVIFGGKSAEREVSIASGVPVFKALKELGHEVLAVDTAKGVLSPADQMHFLSVHVQRIPPASNVVALIQSGPMELMSSPRLVDVDVFFLALHGGAGEDGTLQSYLDVTGIPYTGSSHMPSVYAMDKDIAKRIFRTACIPTPEWLMTPCSPIEVEKRLGFPVVVKPNKQGSTIGLTVVTDVEKLDSAIDEAYQYDDEVMIEKFIPGRELTVGILEDSALTVGEIIPHSSEVFDYQSKYQEGGATEIFPAKLSRVQTRTIQRLGLRAHRALKLQDYSRIDFRMDHQGGIWCLEANSLPGMTSNSLLPQSGAAAGISFPHLCERICQLAKNRHRAKKALKRE